MPRCRNMQNFDSGDELCLLGAALGCCGDGMGTKGYRKWRTYREVDCHANFTQKTEIMQNIVLFTA